MYTYKERVRTFSKTVPPRQCATKMIGLSSYFALSTSWINRTLVERGLGNLFFLSSMVHQLVDQVVGNVSDFVVLVKERTKSRCIIERQDTCVGYFSRQELFGPENIRLGRPRCLVAMQAVDKDDTVGAFG